MNASILQALTELQAAVIQLNETGLHHAFYSYAGHINWVTVYAIKATGDERAHSLDTININVAETSPKTLHDIKAATVAVKALRQKTIYEGLNHAA